MLTKKIQVNKVELLVDKQYIVEKFPLTMDKHDCISDALVKHPTGKFTRHWIGKEEEELRVQSIPVSKSEFVNSVLKKRNEPSVPVAQEVFEEYESV